MTDPVTVQPTRDQLRALANKATPGPWEFQHWGGQNQNGDYAESILFDGDGETMAYGVADQNGEFIAAARTALPRLLDQLDQAEARADRWRDYARTQRHRADDQEDRAIRAQGNLDAAQARAATAEARLQAVEALCDAAEDPDQWPPPRPVIHGGEPFPASLMVDDIRRALSTP